MLIKHFQAIYHINDTDLTQLLQNWILEDEYMPELIEKYSEIVIDRIKNDSLLQNMRVLLRGLE